MRILKYKNFHLLVGMFTFYFLLFNLVLAQQFQLPKGDPLTYKGINVFLDNTAKFLYTAGITLGVITLVITGIMYFWAKSDIEAKNAKGWFRNGIIGTFVILAIGVIIQTIKIIVEGRFFTPGP